MKKESWISKESGRASAKDSSCVNKLLKWYSPTTCNNIFTIMIILLHLFLWTPSTGLKLHSSEELFQSDPSYIWIHLEINNMKITTSGVCPSFPLASSWNPVCLHTVASKTLTKNTLWHSRKRLRIYRDDAVARLCR